MAANVVWSEAKGWHNGPETTLCRQCAKCGVFHVTATEKACSHK